MLDPWQFRTEKRYRQMVLVLKFLDVFWHVFVDVV